MKLTQAQRTEATKHAVMDATMQAIQELGYYRASSNEIARRAGFTWGVIQHHFGSRERLLLAVIDRTADRYLARVKEYEIVGATREQRVASFTALLEELYGAPHYLATLQIMLDLSHDPSFGSGTKSVVTEFNRRFLRDTRRLARRVWPHLSTKRREQEAGALHWLVWGMAVGRNVSRLFNLLDADTMQYWDTSMATRLTTMTAHATAAKPPAPAPVKPRTPRPRAAKISRRA